MDPIQIDHTAHTWGSMHHLEGSWAPSFMGSRCCPTLTNRAKYETRDYWRRDWLGSFVYMRVFPLPKVKKPHQKVGKSEPMPDTVDTAPEPHAQSRPRAKPKVKSAKVSRRPGRRRRPLTPTVPPGVNVPQRLARLRPRGRAAPTAILAHLHATGISYNNQKRCNTR